MRRLWIFRFGIGSRRSAVSNRQRRMWAGTLLLCIGALAAASACGRAASNQRQYTLQGQVIAISADRREATIKHEEIKGFMPAMTMPYKVSDPKLLAGVAPGDLITAMLVVVPNDAYLSAVRKVGNAPLEKPAPEPTATPSASAGFELLKPGARVPNTPFVTQDGRTINFADAFKGSTVVVTFIYTRCPLPTFCPLMDRNFARIQEQLKADPSLATRVHLVTISFDPATDTPAVLKKHAEDLHADPKTWTFLTGNRDDISQFGARLGLSVMFEDDNSITHNLRTAILDPEGRLVKVYTGNEWTSAQVLADLKMGTGVISKES